MLPKQSASYESLPLEKCFILKVTDPLKLLINVLVLNFCKTFLFQERKKMLESSKEKRLENESEGKILN